MCEDRAQLTRELVGTLGADAEASERGNVENILPGNRHYS
jgi:hypothetical protein